MIRTLYNKIFGLPSPTKLREQLDETTGRDLAAYSAEADRESALEEVRLRREVMRVFNNARRELLRAELEMDDARAKCAAAQSRLDRLTTYVSKMPK